MKKILWMRKLSCGHCKEEGFGSNLKGISKTKEHIENRRKVIINKGVYKGKKNPNYKHGKYVKK